MKSALRAERDALRVVRIGLVFHDAGDLLELTADFHNDGLRRALHSAHGERGEDEREHRADEETDQNGGAREREVQNLFRVVLHDVDVGDEQRKSGQRSRADRKALAGSGRGVAQGVESVGALADFLGETGHLGDAAGVVGHGAIGIGGQGDAQGAQHADGSQSDAVQAHAGVGGTTGQEEGQQDADGHDDDGQCGGQHAQAQTADDDGGGAGLALAAQLLGGLIGVGGVVLGGLADQHAGHQAGQNGHIQAPVLDAQQLPHQEEGDDGDQHGGQVGAAGQGLQQGTLVGVLLGLDEEGADDGADDAHSCHDHGDGHGPEGLAGEGGHAQGGGGDDGAYIALVQVSAHTGHVAHVVAHVIGDDGGVAGVVLGDTGFHLAHQVGAHVGGLGKDTAAHTGEQGHGAGAHTEGQHGAGDIGGIQLEHEAQQHEPHADVQQAQTHHGEAHDGAGGERHAQALIQAVAAGVGGAAVGLGGDAHAHEAREAGEEAAGQEGEGHEPGQQTAGCHDAQHHDHAGKEDAHHGVLPLQVRVGALADGAGDLAHQRSALVKAQDALARDEREQQRDDRANKCGYDQILFHNVFSSFFPGWGIFHFCSALYYNKNLLFPSSFQIIFQ